MNSTSTSNIILEIKDLNVVFNLDFYQENSIRDRFVNFVTAPIETILKPKIPLHIIENLNLTIRQGDRLGILGINGAGKTTLCRCIAGMLIPHSGTINLDGEVRSIFNTNIGIIPDLTGRENAFLLARLLFPAKDNTEINEIVNESIEFSELGRFADVTFSKYSKGMQARICLSIISSCSCNLLILDEVFDGADEFFQRKIAKRVLKMIHDSSAAIFISHSSGNIAQACNRVIVMSNSKLVFDGDVSAGIKFYHSLKFRSPTSLTEQSH